MQKGCILEGDYFCHSLTTSESNWNSFVTFPAVMSIRKSPFQCVSGYQPKIRRSNRIHCSKFTFNFNELINAVSISLSRVRKQYVPWTVMEIAWNFYRIYTSRNWHYLCFVLVAWIILLKISTLARWNGTGEILGKMSQNYVNSFGKLCKTFFSTYELC